MKGILRIGVVVLLSIVSFCIYAQKNTLISGQAIKSNPDKEFGRFALPSINAFTMGMADVNNDNHPDLFIQSDRWNPGTYLYHFEKYNRNNEPVFSEAIKLKIPFDKEIQKLTIFVINSY